MKNIKRFNEQIEEESKFIKVKPVKDESGHWYIIPNELIDDFYKDLEDI